MPDYYLSAQAVPNDPQYLEQWGPPQVGAPEAWDISTGSSATGAANGPITVCVIDSGIDPTHPDLAANLHHDIGYNAWDPTQPLNDTSGHGTHISGIIAAVGNNGLGVTGLSWGGDIKVLACAFLEPGGYGLTSVAVVCFNYCIRWAAPPCISCCRYSCDCHCACGRLTAPSLPHDHVPSCCCSKGAQIISASWSDGDVENPPLKEAIQAAGNAGALVVVAAGNQGYNLSVTPSYPAVYSQTMGFVLTVGASDENNSWLGFSNYDATAGEQGRGWARVLAVRCHLLLLLSSLLLCLFGW